MPVVLIPSLLQDYSGGRREVRVPGQTLRQVIENLETECPGIRDKIRDEHGILASLNISVDGELTELGLVQPVAEDSEILILPALAGGSDRARPPATNHATNKLALSQARFEGSR